ncbi:Lipoteichoic acid protein A [Chlamydia abortus]|nr:Lipoteichoic acid protein A [Chlamydia abortus]
MIAIPKAGRSILTLAVVLFCTEFVRSAFLFSFLPNYAVRSLGHSVAIVGLAVSVHYIADTVVKGLAGYLLDRFPLRWLLPATFVIMLSGFLIFFYSTHVSLLLAGSALLGIGASPVWLICLGQVKENQRAEQMGTIYTIWMASLGLGPILVNFTLDQGYAASFFLFILLLAAGFVCSLWTMKENRASMERADVSLHQLWSRLARLKWLLPGMILQMMAAGLLLPILPSFVSEHLGMSQAEYSFMLLLGGAGAILFLIPMGKLADRWGHKRMLGIGFLSLTVILYLVIGSRSVYLTMLLALLLGLAYSAVLPAWNAVLSYAVPKEQKGMGWGILSGIEGIGIMIGPAIGGWVASRYTGTTTVMLSAGMLMIIAIFYLLLPESRLISSHENKQNKNKN